MREYKATVGETDGNIIAAIITTQTPRNQPSVPRPVHGPLSIPRIRSTVHHQPIPARVKRKATSPSRVRAAAKAGPGPPRPRSSCAGRSSGQAAQENSDVERPVFPSYSIPKALIRERFASAIVRSDATGWNMPVNRTGSPVSTPNGNDVLDLEVDHVPDAHAVPKPSSSNLDRRSLDAEHLAYERSKRAHRAAELAR